MADRRMEATRTLVFLGQLEVLLAVCLVVERSRTITVVVTTTIRTTLGQQVDSRTSKAVVACWVA